jgi:hypothetical protein
LRQHWTKLSKVRTSTTTLKNLILAGEEALTKKMDKWNQKLVYVAAYLDPMMRTQVDDLDNLNLIMKKVSVYLVHS